MARRRTELVKADDADTDLLPLVPQQGAGGIEYHRGAEVLQGHGGEPPERPEDILAEPPDARDISAELAAPPRRKLPWLTLLLSAGVVAAAAFAGGALVEKHHLNGTSSAAGRGFTFPAGGAAGRTGTGTGTAGGRTFGGTGATGGFGGAGGTGATGGGTAASGVTVGTVKLVDGSTIYVTDAQGDIVKVTTGGSTKVTESKDGKVSDLRAGQSVTVLGSRNSSGDVAATTVTQGTLPSFGGRFGGGAAGGAAGGGAAGGTGGGN